MAVVTGWWTEKGPMGGNGGGDDGHSKKKLVQFVNSTKICKCANFGRFVQVFKLILVK